MLGMLLFLLVYIAWSVLRWLLTGQKPQVAMVWERYREMRRGAMWQTRPQDQSRSDDVVDVEVREVKPEGEPVKLLK